MELIYTCYRITEIDRSVAFYEALGFEERRRLPIGDEAMGLPGDGDRLERWNSSSGRDRLLPRRERSTPEADLVAVGVPIGRFSDTVRVGLPLSGLDSSGGDLSDHPIEVTDEDRVHRMARVLRLLHDKQEPVLGELPHRLRRVGHEAGLRTQEAFVPRQAFLVVAHRDTGEEVPLHDPTLPVISMPTLPDGGMPRC
jgi:catechol 2,3-dioxygenase-like lactoylglutathione lyase family enzyme